MASFLSECKRGTVKQDHQLPSCPADRRSFFLCVGRNWIHVHWVQQVLQAKCFIIHLYKTFFKVQNSFHIYILFYFRLISMNENDF